MNPTGNSQTEPFTRLILGGTHGNHPSGNPANSGVRREVNQTIGKSLTPDGRCALCRYQIHVLEEPNFAVIKVAVVKVNLEEKRVYAKCPKCKTWLTVPLYYWKGAGRDIT